ncbi:hypothetical protein M514_01762 [Trichuris suis]|uniref:F-box domain-containing protein n=1 Tax=Trichuris suis TaxID=68888 RepID=A0A085NT46_9BILA|nr:hypothetical protein M513_01762 [Trichuris suis]KFD72642.1 hypothetical protein M514_01762 [Trichuris suis]KHJ46449.1 F-box domain protein [Trichuris suis]
MPKETIPLIADWSRLPDITLLNIISYLNFEDRKAVATVCKRWYKLVNCATVWKNVVYEIPGQWARPLSSIGTVIARFGSFHRHVSLRLRSSEGSCIVIATEMLNKLAAIRPRNIESLRIELTDRARVFHRNDYFLLSVKNFLQQRPNRELVPVSRIHLANMVFPADPTFLQAVTLKISDYLTHVNIQAKSATLLLSASSLASLVKKWPNLIDLRVLNVSFSEDVLKSLTDTNHSAFRHLALLYTKQDKYYRRVVPDQLWLEFSRRVPNAIISISVDVTLPFSGLLRFVTKSMPLWNLYIESRVNAHQFNQLTMKMNVSLRKLVLRSIPTDNIEEVLKSLVDRFLNMKVLYIVSNVKLQTIEYIQRKNPKLRHNLSGTYSSILTLSDSELYGNIRSP